MTPFFEGNAELSRASCSVDIPHGTFGIGDLADRTNDIAIDQVTSTLVFTLSRMANPFGRCNRGLSRIVRIREVGNREQNDRMV